MKGVRYHSCANFTWEAIQSRTFVCWEVFCFCFFINDCLDFLSCKASVQLCSFFLIQLQKIVCFPKFIRFPDCLIWWHILVCNSFSCYVHTFSTDIIVSVSSYQWVDDQCPLGVNNTYCAWVSQHSRTDTAVFTKASWWGWASGLGSGNFDLGRVPTFPNW